MCWFESFAGRLVKKFDSAPLGMMAHSNRLRLKSKLYFVVVFIYLQKRKRKLIGQKKKCYWTNKSNTMDRACVFLIIEARKGISGLKLEQDI